MEESHQIIPIVETAMESTPPMQIISIDALRNFEREMQLLRSMRESHNENALLFKYEVGSKITSIVDDAGHWNAQGVWAGVKEQAVQTYGARTLEEAAQSSGWDVEQLRACVRLYRAWNPTRFNYLIALTRDNGTHLFTYRVMQRLQTVKLPIEKRTELENKYIETQVNGDDFITEIGRAANAGKERRARPVNNQETAARRFTQKAQACIESFTLVNDFEKAVKGLGDEVDSNQKKEVKSNITALTRLLKDLQVRAAKALEKLEQMKA